MIRGNCPGLLGALVFTIAVSAPASIALAAYDQPQPLLGVLHAPSPPFPIVNPDGTKILLISELQYPPMSRVAEPFLRWPVSASSRGTTAGMTRRAVTASARARPDFTLVDVANGSETRSRCPQARA